MKFRIIIAVLILVSTGAFVFSRGAFAQTGTTGTATPTFTATPTATMTATANQGASAASNVCRLADAQDMLLTVGHTGTTTSGSATAIPVTGATATASPTATATTAAGATTGTATATPMATATQAPTATSSTGTGSVPTTGGAVVDVHEVPYCVGYFRMDIGVPFKADATVTSADFGAITPSTAMTPGTTTGAGGIPVTGGTTTTGTLFRPNYGFDVYDVNALAGGNAITVSVNNAQGVAHMEICGADPTGSANVYQWYTAKMWSSWYKSTTTPARWVLLPTSHTKGLACAQSWLPGTYAVH